jgi:energy-coupling factor transporter transmembrane protein EcfT
MERTELKYEKTSILKKPSFINEIDVGIKLFGFLLLIIVLLLSNQFLGVFLVFINVFFLSLLSKVTIKYVLKNILSFGIIFFIPYGFAIILTLVLKYLNIEYISNLDMKTTLIRIIKIILTGYLSNLYLYTTPLEEFSSMLNKVLRPFKRVAKIITDYTIVIMIVLEEISEMTGKYKNIFIKSLKGLKFHLKLKSVPNVIVEIIVNSFERLDIIQKKLINTKNIKPYKFKFTFKDVSFLFLIIIQIIILYSIL